MREGVIADRIAKKVPSQHWLPIAVVAGITLVFVTKYTLEAVVSVAVYGGPACYRDRRARFAG